MIKLKSIFKKILPKGIVSFISFYKANTKERKQGIYKYFSEESINFLKHFTNFQIGEVSFLGQRIKFSDASGLVHSVEEIFCEEVYLFNSTQEYPYIIDCGANIGISIMYFKKLYPKAKILAFEPDPTIFELLKENIKIFEFENIELLNKAVWNKTEELSFYHEGSLAGSLTTDFAYKNSIKKVCAIDFIPYLNQPIDFLKIDIEGAEYIVLKHVAHHLSDVKKMFVEFHGDKNKPQELHHLLSIVSEAGFRYYLREAAFLVRNPFTSTFYGPYDIQINIFCYR